MSNYKRYIKNINKQYGKNIKAFEEVTLDANIPKYTEDLFKKYDLDLSTRSPMISIMHKRWGFPSRAEQTISSYEDIERIATEEE